jgi:uncharacterized protein (TIGR00106 family)
MQWTKGDDMLVEFSIVPLGSGSSISSRVAEVLGLVDASGLAYKVTPMGTVVEGTWDEVFRLIKRCHRIVLQQEERVLTTIRIDDRKGAANRIDAKVRSVEKKLGKALKK